MIHFSDMGKQERMAWIMASGSALIALYLLGGFADLLRLNDGLVTNAPGLLRLCIETAVLSAALEIGAGFIRRQREDAVDRDERDEAIRRRANIASLTAFGLMATACVFTTMPMGFLGVHAVDTGTMGGAMVCLLALSSLTRHIAEIILYKRG